MSRFVKFAVTGIAGTILDFLAFNLVLVLTGHPVLARGIGYVFGTLWAFFVNRSWVFKSQNGISSLIPFLALYGSSGFVAVTIQSFLNEGSGVFIAYIFSLVVASVMNFVGMRFLVFRNSSNAS
jgi:putative flippase GtrA